MTPTPNGVAIPRRYTPSPYPRPILYAVVLALLTANIINIGADLGAMGAALKLVIDGPQFFYVALFAVISLLLEMFVRYALYVSMLKWLTLVLFAYVGVAFVAHMPWATVGHHLLVPRISFKADYLTVVVAILGTTISPYLFFWQAEEEVEDVRERDGAKPLARAPEQAPTEFSRIRWDTYVGMGLSNAVALFIILTTAATLHAHGLNNIQTSSQAAEALRPIAGPAVFLVFALGIIERACWRCPCWEALRPMRSESVSDGTSAWRANPIARRGSMASWLRRHSSARA